MTKKKIFIDFEAISAPFRFEIKQKFDVPFAYTFGLFLGKKFKCKTTIINFEKIRISQINEFIYKDICSFVKKIVNNKEFVLNNKTIEFIGWNPILEKKILNKIHNFKKIEVKNQVYGSNISLTKVTKKEFDKEYFSITKKLIQKNINTDFINKRGLNEPGSIAALVGYLFYLKASNKKGKYYFNFDYNETLKELIDYSKDDILRMKFLSENSHLLDQRSKEVRKWIKDKNTSLSQIYHLEKKINILKNFNENITIKEAKRIAKKELEKTIKIKEELEQKF